ncbi:NAD(P)H-hydrate dehydratase [Treponema phagedenis]|uniref:NAD(P)H-hydrate dehydratase n=1 Tax=Treponema phagedenis TaxID=162 RepID=UPI0011E7164B|nr:NAD(P)H-hydrate dehydratase [Treponema phagedenis]QEJ94461.1 NAD(P)H-hydrate dehydratase [Treponema phagedenis]
MQKVFDSLRKADIESAERHDMRDGFLMENAARGTAEKIKALIESGFCRTHKPLIQIVCGSGDNGGDGLALARMLADYAKLIVVQVKEPKSPLCKLQAKRLCSVGIEVADTIAPVSDILIDALIGTGLETQLNEETIQIIEKMNAVKTAAGTDAYGIAIDMPSGLNMQGIPSPVCFQAECTYSMGALKTAFYSDYAKDFVKRIECIDLGIPRSVYESAAEQSDTTAVLEPQDLCLPVRKKQNTYKTSYGHALFFCGEKEGACCLAASAALHFGSGLVSLCGNKPVPLPFDFMFNEYALTQPLQAYSAIALGSGLGEQYTENALAFLQREELQNMPLVLDADILHQPELVRLLPNFRKTVLTPHPKEFASLLRSAGAADADVQTVQENRFALLRNLSKEFPQTVIILKGANPLIAQNGTIMINPLGTNALSKAGTGDVLAGLVTALLAQGLAPFEAAVQASLAHATASRFAVSSYALTATKLIELCAQLPELIIKEAD